MAIHRNLDGTYHWACARCRVTEGNYLSLIEAENDLARHVGQHDS